MPDYHSVVSFVTFEHVNIFGPVIFPNFVNFVEFHAFHNCSPLTVLSLYSYSDSGSA